MLCYDADFAPWGAERAYISTCPSSYKFEGKERDTESNNDDFGARYFSSSFGRWTSADWSAVPAPVPYANLTNPQTLNLYAMVSDSPETFTELDGHNFQPAPQSDYTGATDFSGQSMESGYRSLGGLSPYGDSYYAYLNVVQRDTTSSEGGWHRKTITLNGRKVTVRWRVFVDRNAGGGVAGRGIEIEATPGQCSSNCHWAQTASGTGRDGTPRGIQVDIQPGATDAHAYPFTALTEEAGQLYDRPERSMAPANLNFVISVSMMVVDSM